MKKFRVAFCGTPEFSVPTLDLLSNHPHIELVKVISMPDRPAGRGMELKSPEVIEFAKTKKSPFFQTENINKEPQMIQELKELELDFIVVLAFAQFLGSEMLTLSRLGCFNIHTSVLPKYRGAAPIQYALLNGDKETGVSKPVTREDFIKAGADKAMRPDRKSLMTIDTQNKRVIAKFESFNIKK
jgi:methionyl-tRNA formyltransferase